MTITDEQARQFASLFAGRDDAFGVMLAKGGVQSVRQPLTFPRYQRHLTDPTSSLGVYPLRDDGTCSFVVADIDKDDLATATEIRDNLAGDTVFAFIERSKSKGYHVWVFFKERTPALAARAYMQHALDRAHIRAEIFPKQDKLDVGQVGNFINLPYAANAPTGRRVIVSDGGTIYSLERFLAEALAYRSTLPTSVPTAPTKPKDKKRLPVVVSEPRPACMQAIVDTPANVGEGYRNEALMRLAAYEINTAQSPDAYALVAQVGDDMGLPLDEVNHVLKMTEKGGYEYGCARKREVPLCEAACNHELCRFDPGYARSRSAGPPPLPTNLEEEAEEEDEPEVEPDPPTESSRYDEDTAIARTATPFLRVLTDYAEATSGVPRMAFYADMIALISGCLGNRVRIKDMGGNYIYPHLWLLVLGTSGSGKTSAMKAAQRHVVGVLDAKRWLSPTGSMESWLSQLAEESSRIMVQDEIVTWLQQLRRKGLEGGKSIFTLLYSWDNTRAYQHATISRGPTDVWFPAITLIAASTVDYFQQAVTADDFRSGFLGRLLILPLEGTLVDPTEERNDAYEDDVRERLAWIVSRQGEMHVSVEARQRLRAWQKERQTGAYLNAPGEAEGIKTRLAEFALKVAVCLHVTEAEMDSPLWHIISDENVERAITFLDWLVPRQLHFIEFGLAGSDHERKCQLLRDRLARAPGKAMSRSALRRSFGWEPRFFDAVIETLHDQRYVKVDKPKPLGPGRPAEMIRLVRKRA